MEHIQEYIETVEKLPREIQRIITEEQKKDAQNQDIERALEEKTKKINKKKSINNMEKTEICALLESMLENAEEKIILSQKGYLLTLNHIKKLRFNIKNLIAEEKDIFGEGWLSENGKKTFCICNNETDGNMIACDNDTCLFQWFHYKCVGLKTKPSGKWYCEICRNDFVEKELH